MPIHYRQRSGCSSLVAGRIDEETWVYDSAHGQGGQTASSPTAPSSPSWGIPDRPHSCRGDFQPPRRGRQNRAPGACHGLCRGWWRFGVNRVATKDGGLGSGVLSPRQSRLGSADRVDQVGRVGLDAHPRIDRGLPLCYWPRLDRRRGAHFICSADLLRVPSGCPRALPSGAAKEVLADLGSHPAD